MGVSHRWGWVSLQRKEASFLLIFNLNSVFSTTASKAVDFFVCANVCIKLTKNFQHPSFIVGSATTPANAIESTTQRTTVQQSTQARTESANTTSGE